MSEDDDRAHVPYYFPGDFDLDTGAGQIMSDEEYIAWFEENRINRGGEEEPAPDAVVDVEAEVGALNFRKPFSDPDVDVTHNRELSDHSIVSGESDDGSDESYALQARGNRPTQIEIVGWVTGNQLRVVDEMVAEPFVGVTTDRWLGTAVPEEVRTGYNREFHPDYGMIFEVTISLLAVVRGELPPDTNEYFNYRR